MSRRPRILDPSHAHSVAWVGAAKRPLVPDAVSADACLRLLAEEVRRGSFRVLGYCLQRDVVDLLLDRFGPRPHRGLARFAGRYARTLNARTGRSGSAFPSRYTSVPVVAAHHLAAALRLLAWAPDHAGRARRPEDWALGSHRAHLGLDPVDWVASAEVLRALFHPDLSEARRRYVAYVYSRDPSLLMGDRVRREAQVQDLRGYRLAGTPPALDQPARPIGRAVRAQPWFDQGGSQGGGPAPGGGAPVPGPCSTWADRCGRCGAALSPTSSPYGEAVDVLVDEVAAHYGLSRVTLADPGRSRRPAEARAVAAFLALESGVTTLGALSRVVGRGAPTLSEAATRLLSRMATIRAVRLRVQLLRERLEPLVLRTIRREAGLPDEPGGR